MRFLALNHWSWLSKMKIKQNEKRGRIRALPGSEAALSRTPGVGLLRSTEARAELISSLPCTFGLLGLLMTRWCLLDNLNSVSAASVFFYT